MGSAGNLLTLRAVPWAQDNKVLGFNISPLKYTTIFIVNLALADFLYCVTSLPMYSTTYLHRGWPSGEDSWTCRGFAAFRYMTAYSAWMALGFVAFSRSVVRARGKGVASTFLHLVQKSRYQSWSFYVFMTFYAHI